jgi:hypothetical protein
MRRSELEHVLRAAAGITGERLFVIVGCTAVLIQYPDAPDDLVQSREVDIYPKHKPELADLIEGCIGQGSVFEETFGYHADGVGPGTAVLPDGWEDRAVRLPGTPNTAGADALAPEIHDLVAAKLYAGREKDLEWVAAAVRHGLLDQATVAERVGALPQDVKGGLARQRAGVDPLATPPADSLS